MAEILVSAQGSRYVVTLKDGASVSHHEVSASSGDLQRLGLEDCEPHAVVEESFRFLLEREPKEAILADFDLSTIARYFPEYPEEIRRRMRGALD